MYALLIHIIGYLAVDAAMPGWVEEAEWLILSTWYGAFVAVDLMAMMACNDFRLWRLLALSAAWSAAIMIEISMGSDILQQADTVVQIGLDIAIAVMALNLYAEWRKGRKNAVKAW